MRFSSLKHIPWCAFMAVATFLACCDKKPNRSKHIIPFGGEEWLFPSTIGEAVQKHKLLFKPPAYYYKIWGNQRQVTVYFDWISGDFDNDLQQKQEIYDRDVNTYTFHIKRTEGAYDSLKNVIESIYHKKFQLIKGNRSTSSLLTTEKVRPFQHYLIIVDNDLTIGIKNSHYHELGDVVTVHFMYGLSLGDIGNVVANP